MKTTLRILLAGMLLGAPAWAGPAEVNDSPGWNELRGRCAGMGSAEDQSIQILDLCQKRGLTASEAKQLLEPVYAAASESLPTCSLMAKIREGLSKQASVGDIVLATEARLNCMRQAGKILSEAADRSADAHRKGPDMLIENTGMALESGLDPAVVTAVIRYNGRRQLGRLAHVMEAAETLHLEGFEDQQIQRVLIDFLDRSLNRQEMNRAVGVLKDGLDKGAEFETVYTTLWVAPR